MPGLSADGSTVTLRLLPPSAIVPLAGAALSQLPVLDACAEGGPPTLPFERDEVDRIAEACGRVEDDNLHKRARTRARLPRRHPANPDVGGRAHAVDQLRAMMLDVADINELVLQLGHAIPTEATLRAVKI